MAISYTDLLLAEYGDYEILQAPIPIQIPPHQRPFQPYRGPGRPGPLLPEHRHPGGLYVRPPTVPPVRFRDRFGNRWLISRALGRLLGVFAVLMPDELGNSELPPDFFRQSFQPFVPVWRGGYMEPSRFKRAGVRKIPGIIEVPGTDDPRESMSSQFRWRQSTFTDLRRNRANPIRDSNDLFDIAEELGLVPEVGTVPRIQTESPAGWMRLRALINQPNIRSIIAVPEIPIRPVPVKVHEEEYPAGAFYGGIGPTNLAPLSPIHSPGWVGYQEYLYQLERVNITIDNFKSIATFEGRFTNLDALYAEAYTLWKYHGDSSGLDAWRKAKLELTKQASYTTIEFHKLHRHQGKWAAVRASKQNTPNRPADDRKVRSGLGAIIQIYDLAGDWYDVFEAAAQAVVLDFENGPDRNASQAWRRFLNIVWTDGMAAGVDYLGGIRGVVEANPFRIGYNILTNEIEDRMYGLGYNRYKGVYGDLMQLMGIMRSWGIFGDVQGIGVSDYWNRTRAQVVREFMKSFDFWMMEFGQEIADHYEKYPRRNPKL